MGLVMIKSDKEDRFYYQKKGLFYFLCLVFVSVFLFSLFFGKFNPYIQLVIDVILFLLSGPVTEIFVGSESVLRALPFMLAPLPFLFFVKKEGHFKIYIGVFLTYWIAWGILNFYLYMIS